MRRRRVLVLQRYVPQYRVPFFEGLRDRLDDAGVDLHLAHGAPDPIEAARGDEASVPWATRLPELRIGRPSRRHLVWQHVRAEARSADLIVSEQASRLLSTTFLLAVTGRAGLPPVALWGHGENLRRHDASRVAEMGKRWSTRRCHWFFAYTDATAELLASQGFPSNRTTVVDNAVATDHIQAVAARYAEDRAALRADLGLADAPTGVLVSSLYPEKRVRYLLDAARAIKRLLPRFQLVVAGGGPDAQLMRSGAEEHDWIRYLGPRFGPDKARLLVSADVYLSPGLIGLGILDAFAAGLPVITTDQRYHSPEISYLRHDGNGVVLAEQASPSEFARAATDLLGDHDRLDRLSAEAVGTAQTYSVDRMVTNFADGVLSALET